MKTKVRSTSLMAFNDLRKENKLNPREQEVLQALQRIEPACDRDLGKHLGWELGSISGRRNSLVNKGRVIEAFKHKSITGKTVSFWKLANDQTEMFEYTDTH